MLKYADVIGLLDQMEELLADIRSVVEEMALENNHLKSITPLECVCKPPNSPSDVSKQDG